MDPFAAYARYYDADLAELVDDILLYQEFAERCGSPILELGCGTGRVLLPLAQAGYDVTGVDTSPAMLDAAREKVRAAGLQDRVTLVEQDMRTLDLRSRFGLVVIAVSSFLHMLTQEDQLQALASAARHLSAGGLLVMDLFDPDLGRLLEPPGQVTLLKTMTDPETGRRWTKFRTQRVDLARQRIDTTYLIDEIDEQGIVHRAEFPFSLRYVFRAELELLLRLAGFEVEAIYGSFDLDEYGAESDRILAVARWPRTGKQRR